MASTITTDINYYLDPSLGGITSYIPGTAGILRRKFDTHTVMIQDLRSHKEHFNIHVSSFEVSKYDIAMDGTSDEEMKKVVYPQAEELIKKITGASRVVCFSHLIRRNTVESNRQALAVLEANMRDNPIPDSHGFGKVVPARFAHIDQSAIGARTLLNDNLPDEAETLAKRRWGTINLWRPLKTIRRDPFAVCDSRTIRDEDLAIVESTLPSKGSGKGYYDTVSKGKGFQTLELRANPEHRWYYISNMTPEECLVFKMHDSKKSLKGRCGHTSFVDSSTKDDDPVRESMELRFFVFYDEASE